MSHAVVPDFVAPQQKQGKPVLSSHDSGPEFSFVHWLEVRRLVELAEQEDREMKGYVFDDAALLVSNR